jgi:hypothetical protein
MSKFIDSIDKAEKRAMQRHRYPRCPYPKSCLPVSYHIGSNGAGNCAGILYKSNNLDCIRQCIFFETKRHKVKILEHFMTPTEALDQAHSLTLVTRYALDANSNFKTHYENLCNIRIKGCSHPAELSI